MSNVVTLNRPRIADAATRSAALARCFAQHRRGEEDVFWLKENAELLNILECTGTPVGPGTLEAYEGFYATALQRLEFFPQYYRFLLSLAIDLEELGLPGDAGERMVSFAARQDLPAAELSDLQRAEARRLMIRRGIDPIGDPGLDDRLAAFASRTATFALPNKKAAYELTHIVYYLSEYGRVTPKLPSEVVKSLHFAGLTAFIDQNADLLAEICIALVYMGEEPPALWARWLMRETAAFAVETGEQVSVADDYHEFFICNWFAACAGEPTFRKALSPERMNFTRAPRQIYPLREMSQALMMCDQRGGDWDVMRPQLAPQLSEATRETVQAASESSQHFPAFFEGFSRAARA